MKRALLEVAALTLLLTAIDQLYRGLHPDVNLVRATLVGLTAWAALGALARLRASRIPVLRGALAIFASAFLSVLAIEAGALVSRSPASAAAHVALLAASYLALEAWSRRRRRMPTAAAAPSRLAGSACTAVGVRMRRRGAAAGAGRAGIATVPTSRARGSNRRTSLGRACR